MKRKYFSALLMGALTIASVSTFTSCKDYDDDIDKMRRFLIDNFLQETGICKEQMDEMKEFIAMCFPSTSVELPELDGGVA